MCTYDNDGDGHNLTDTIVMSLIHSYKHIFQHALTYDKV